MNTRLIATQIQGATPAGWETIKPVFHQVEVDKNGKGYAKYGYLLANATGKKVRLTLPETVDDNVSSLQGHYFDPKDN